MSLSRSWPGRLHRVVGRPQWIPRWVDSLRQKVVVVFMAADPEPSDDIALSDAEGAVVDRDSGREDGPCGVNALEP
jgi:hypothetical protein